MTTLPDIRKFQTILFDCDGVLLNSNRLKTDAFRAVAIEFGQNAARELVDYHVANGGVSRQKKFDYFARHIIKARRPQALADRLVDLYGAVLRDRLQHCEGANGLSALRRYTLASQWGVVSGGSQAELRAVFAQRGLSSHFDLGIWGNPKDKCALLKELLTDQLPRGPGLYLGDSRYDHVAAEHAGLSFVFVSGWTEFSGWREYCDDRNIPVISSLVELLPADVKG
ncbi:HAD family hydrolase [Algiphilus sp. NNCM1]|uniref:HAD family hydrolase n=1 Tax=Algiphilus sp. TaxID=1872431 RepID=UPI001CA66DA3|nr:HAD family hydrolase [Algiphilus sp.]MBY8965049.1 HAD family hydrolase [Algiphilus acroporae]MCI5104202.1 HAD hydrolase-like protein [Algiphilus sp.]